MHMEAQEDKKVTFLDRVVTYRLHDIHMYNYNDSTPHIDIAETYMEKGLDELFGERCRKNYFGYEYINYSCEDFSLLFKGFFPHEMVVNMVV